MAHYAERLRGKFKANEYQNVVLPIIMIRRLEKSRHFRCDRPGIDPRLCPNCGSALARRPLPTPQPSYMDTS